MKAVMATNNVNKLHEAQEILAPLGIEVISQREAGADIEPEENGATFAENAMIKAKTVYDIVHCPVFADDSGLCVAALDGRPGVHSARYAPKGQECEKLLAEMEGVEDRRAYFECDIAYIDEKGSGTFSAACIGSIGTQARGENGFGYDPVFCYGDRTFAEMGEEEKNAVSHRGIALRKLYEVYRERYGEQDAEQ